MSKKINIAIDGYSSCGKSTLAKAIAKEIKYIYVDSGAMYRAVTLYCLENEIMHADGSYIHEELLEGLRHINISFNYSRTQGKSETFLNGQNVEEEIRSLRVSSYVSKVAKIKEVREQLVKFQQKLGKKKGVVMDGRDIGTVVFPQAELKIFMTANQEIRAQRRFDELIAKGQVVTLEDVDLNLRERDRIDTTRKENPLRKADDAITLDNSHLSHSQQLAQAIAWINERT